MLFLARHKKEICYGKIKELTQNEFRTMQFLELDMLGEFDRECRNHGNTYCITKNYIRGLRHKGYMMCDYDADIAMQREECEKFRKVVNEENLSTVIFETIIKIRCILGNTKKMVTFEPCHKLEKWVK